MAQWTELFQEKVFKRQTSGDIPGGLAIKTLPPNAGGAGSIPDWVAKIPHALRPKNPKALKKKKKKSNILTDSIKVLKSGPCQKIKKKKKKE